MVGFNHEGTGILLNKIQQKNYGKGEIQR